jgi:aconitate hydratase
MAETVLSSLVDSTNAARALYQRPLTFSEKILFAHQKDKTQLPIRGETYVEFMPDRVIMQDATAQMALLQLMVADPASVAVPTTVHCDHLIQAREGADRDLSEAQITNAEVYDFLRSASARYGIGFWEPGSGIIHQVVLEQYAFPGQMIIGTDSHTPNAGGLGAIAIGVGGADAVDVMVGEPFNLRSPKLIGVHLKGRLNGWTSPKDVILKVAELLSVKGGTGAVIEYFGEGTKSISATGRATICNMGAELGATCSVFPADEATLKYLETTGRADIAHYISGHLRDLGPDQEVLETPDAFFDQVVEIDLSQLKPQIVGPHTPDLGRDTASIGEEAKAQGWPLKLSWCLVGSCTNSSYEDIARAASVARWAADNHLKVTTPLLVTPGSERIRRTIERDGLLADLERIGATVLANACGPCIGQWKRQDHFEGETNSILTSYNRNFPKRNDGNPSTLAFIGSPEIVVAYALAGTLDFDPLTQAIDGKHLPTPSGSDLPSNGLAALDSGFVAPPQDATKVVIKIRDGSDRLQALQPFEPWDGQDFTGLAVLLKAVGKCTTDHISAAGPWLRYRGHLDNISRNLFLGVKNAFTSETGTGYCRVHDAIESLPEIARHYKDASIGWVAIGDENYGEGSSREHAAMEPRYLGAKAIIARSFARIAETNLKKQGLLPLTFRDKATYDFINVTDTVDILGLDQLAPDVPVKGRINHANGTYDDFEMDHTLSAEHIEWFKAGSALNLIRLRHT